MLSEFVTQLGHQSFFPIIILMCALFVGAIFWSVKSHDRHKNIAQLPLEDENYETR